MALAQTYDDLRASTSRPGADSSSVSQSLLGATFQTRSDIGKVTTNMPIEARNDGMGAELNPSSRCNSAMLIDMQANTDVRMARNCTA
jgi:hypothetical protein